MRTLYFDIDGTIVLNDHEGCKPLLAEGRFESAIRDAEIEQLVCVGNFVDVVRFVLRMDSSYDELKALFGLCRGAFANEAWFRRHTTFIADPASRAEHVNLESDWWYVDDLAEQYFRAAKRERVFYRERGKRIMVPSPNGDGQDILQWLSSIPRV